MAVRKILEHPHPHLHQCADAATTFDADLAQLADDLIDTLKAAGGIGLSAPQIDEHRRVLVLVPSEPESSPAVYVNPEIRFKSAWGVVEESCLSVPGVKGNVVRATNVTVAAQDRHGQAFERELQGMDAVCMQHEIDHLDGILFIDRLSIAEKIRQRILAALRPRSAQAPQPHA